MPGGTAWPRPRALAEVADRWHQPHDLLHEAGFAFAEDRYTSLLAWALRPSTHPASAAARQATLLSFFEVVAVGLAVPETQFTTVTGGIPDMVLRWDDVVVIIEAKTGTSEHEVPGGGWQTVAYADAVRATLRLPDSLPILVGYLTPDGHSARSDTARRITFLALVERLARSLDGFSLDARTESAFAMLFSHMFDHARPQNLDVRAALATVHGGDPPVAHLPALLRIIELLTPGATP